MVWGSVHFCAWNRPCVPGVSPSLHAQQRSRAQPPGPGDSGSVNLQIQSPQQLRGYSRSISSWGAEVADVFEVADAHSVRVVAGRGHLWSATSLLVPAGAAGAPRPS